MDPRKISYKIELHGKLQKIIFLFVFGIGFVFVNFENDNFHLTFEAFLLHTLIEKPLSYDIE